VFPTKADPDERTIVSCPYAQPAASISIAAKCRLRQLILKPDWILRRLSKKRLKFLASVTHPDNDNSTIAQQYSISSNSVVINKLLTLSYGG
jgi:hypothetical protein